MTAADIGQRLNEVIDGLNARGIDARLIGSGGDEVTVDHVGIDSRQCRMGELFACISGRHHDGHDHAREAVAAGAIALLVERPLDLEVPQILVPCTRAAVGPIASALHGEPSTKTTVIGITGTNGKTTVASMVAAVLESSGSPATVIGTLSGRLTTPEAPDLQRMIREAADAGRAVVMEVSSHALVEHRVDGITFAVGAFTNLGRDHLDLHGSMEDYFRAKASLFTVGCPATSVINIGDTHGRLLADTLTGSEGTELRTVSIDDVHGLELAPTGSTFVLGDQRWSIPLVGRPHVENAIVARGICQALGVDDERIAVGLNSMKPVPGRLEFVTDGDGDIDVVVDFAHTPDALDAVIETCRELGPGRRIVVVVGCGGNRDIAKRPEMGRAASTADRVILTSDNPRAEDPVAIVEAMLSGVPDSAREKTSVVVDRRDAIVSAIQNSSPGDLIVIAGRGHETVQEIAGQLIEFDDREVARGALGVQR